MAREYKKGGTGQSRRALGGKIEDRAWDCEAPPHPEGPARPHARASFTRKVLAHVVMVRANRAARGSAVLNRPRADGNHMSIDIRTAGGGLRGRGDRACISTARSWACGGAGDGGVRGGALCSGQAREWTPPRPPSTSTGHCDAGIRRRGRALSKVHAYRISEECGRTRTHTGANIWIPTRISQPPQTPLLPPQTLTACPSEGRLPAQGPSEAAKNMGTGFSGAPGTLSADRRSLRRPVRRAARA